LSAKYNLSLDYMTGRRIKSMASKLLEISKERWMDEFDKILKLEGDNLQLGLLRLWSHDIFKYTIPELSLQLDYEQNSHYHDFFLHLHTMKVVGAVPNDINWRWAALLHDIAKPFVRVENPKGHSNYMTHELLGAEMCERIALHLKWSTSRRKIVVDLVRTHLNVDSILKPYDDASKKFII